MAALQYWPCSFCLQITRIIPQNSRYASRYVYIQNSLTEDTLTFLKPAFPICHCVYAIYHLYRPAGRRIPGNSAFYHICSGIADASVLSFYGYCIWEVLKDGDNWTTILPDQSLTKSLVPITFYALIASSSLHLLSMVFSTWLFYAFFKIWHLPPDMNPLEDNLTARPTRKRQKLEHRRSIGKNSAVGPATSPLSKSPQESVSRLHEYVPGNPLQNSGMSVGSQRLYRPEYRMTSSSYDSYASYHELPLEEKRPESLARQSMNLLQSNGQRPVGKFTETWAPTGSMISRTNERNRHAAAAMGNKRQSYAPVNERYNLEDYDSDLENNNVHELLGTDHGEVDLSSPRHPNPLGSNPCPPSLPTSNSTSMTFYRPFSKLSADGSTVVTISRAPYSPVSLSSVESKRIHPLPPTPHRIVSTSQDITDQAPETSTKPWQNGISSSTTKSDQQCERYIAAKKNTPSKRNTLIKNNTPTKKYAPVNTDIGFYSKPYGELRNATPPIRVGGNRKVSSGNDFDSKYNSTVYERRNVSGKIAEEGRGGQNNLQSYGFGQYVGKKA